MTHSAIDSCVTFLFVPHFDVICDVLLNRRTATLNLVFKYKAPERTRIKQRRITSRSQPAQLGRGIGYTFLGSSLSPPKSPVVNERLNEKQILCFQCYRNKIKQTRSRHSYFLFFLEQGVMFWGFVSQIWYQYAFTKNLRGTHTSEI